MQPESLLHAVDWGRYERVVVVSPHLDDAALSCGGLLLRLADRVSRRVVVTVCAGDPVPGEAVASDGTLGRRRIDGHTPPDVRRREDEAAMRSLGCEYVHANFPDAIYRQRPGTDRLLYPAARDKWVRPRIEDARHVHQVHLLLERLCTRLGPTLVVSPLGIGFHVDHAICANVASWLEGPDVDLLYYEDFPYVVHPLSGNEDRATRAMARVRLEPVRRLGVAIDAEAKTEALRLYESQIPEPLFDGEHQFLECLNARTFQGEPAEFFWKATRRE